MAETKIEAAKAMLMYQQQMFAQMHGMMHQQAGAGGMHTPSSSSSGPSTTPLPNPFLSFFDKEM